MKDPKFLLFSLLATILFQHFVIAQSSVSVSPNKLLYSEDNLSADLSPGGLDLFHFNKYMLLKAGELRFASDDGDDHTLFESTRLLFSEDINNSMFNRDVELKPRHLYFSARNTDIANGIDRESWILGPGTFGFYDPDDPVTSIFSLSVSKLKPSYPSEEHYFFRANPISGALSIGTENVGVSAQLFVNEEDESTASIWAAHSGNSNANNSFGIYGSNISLGSSNHFGVFGYGSGASGTSYGVYGQAGSGNTTYGVYASGNLAYTGNLSNVSDRKFKKNIKPFSALDRVMQLQPRTYDMKRDQYRRMHLAEGRQFGFIAQELQEVFPELVHQGMHVSPYEEEPGQLLSESIDYLGVDYISLVPILTQAIQEQQELIDEKDRRITRLEAHNDQLSERLTEVETVLRELINSTSKPEEQVPGSSSGASLMQNWPNPFRGNTTVPFYLPNDINRAELQITDVNGRVLQTRTVSGRGKGHLNLAAGAWSSGIYFCSLLVDGKIVDTRQMRVIH